MKERLSLLVLILYLVIALPTRAQTSATFTPTVTGSYVIARDIYVRGGPSETFLPVGRLIAGATLTPLNRSENGGWVMIRYNRGFGWIRSDLAVWALDVDTLPTLDETTLTPTPAQSDTPTLVPTGVRVSAGSEGAYVRFGPGMNYPFLGAIVTGDYVEPIGRNVEGDWILIRFRDGFGWIARQLTDGTLDLNGLPVLLTDALTPSATFTPSTTPRFTPTNTPSSTATSTVTLIPTNTPPNTATLTVTNTASSTPSAFPTNTATPTPSDPPSRTPSPTPTFTLTNTSSPSATLMPTQTDTLTFTATNTPTSTSTAAPTDTPTRTPTALPSPTETPIAIAAAISTAAATATNTASVTPTDTRTATPSPTNTLSMTPTESPTPTDTPSRVATATRTPSATASATPEENAALAATATTTRTTAPTFTLTFTPSETPSLTVTPSPTSTPLPSLTAPPTPSPTPTMTESPVAAAAATGAPPTPAPEQTTQPNTPSIPPEAVVGGALLVLVLGYVALYWRGLTAADRYVEGFVIDHCPVCKQGHLTVETRQVRMLGIPRPQAIVRCDVCRSVLREVGDHRWRYAVDRAANPALYNQLNGRVISEEALVALEHQDQPEPPRVRPPSQSPTFVDDED